MIRKLPHSDFDEGHTGGFRRLQEQAKMNRLRKETNKLRKEMNRSRKETNKLRKEINRLRKEGVMFFDM